jgi:hypothetical protein
MSYIQAINSREMEWTKLAEMQILDVDQLLSAAHWRRDKLKKQDSFRR